MSLKIEEVTKEKFSKFGDFINPYSVISTDINMNTTKSYFDLANIEIDGEDKRVRLNLFEAKKRIFPLKIIISKSVKNEIGEDYKTRKLEAIKVKGKRKPVEIFKVLT